MVNKDLHELLITLGLEKTVFFRNKEDGEVFNLFPSDISKKLDVLNPDAFYVFDNQPLILFFDFTLINNKDKENEIHKQVWSFDNSPIIFIIKGSEIKVYNALNYSKKENSLEEINLSKKDIEDKFSFWNLQSGKTFEWFYDKYKKTVLKKRVNQQLFENIKRTILILKEDFNLEESLAKILVLRLIFIRYLIDRRIKIDISFIEGDENDIITRRKSLSELISTPVKLVEFFDYLNNRFNGVLFKDSNAELTYNQSDILSKLFNPDGVSIEDKRNLFSDFDFQFEVFDFGIIPVELISGIYETLLDAETKDATSAVYTPPFLVDYILTQTVDKFFENNKSISECKIFDPAMGSGIFLVQGLRRMIEREKEINPTDDNQTFGNKIREIAERNLFGIDINEEAINVACFSIYVALLDYQEPGNIDQYIFPNLKNANFFKAHFFDLAKDEIWNKIKGENINFILGNPPWKSNNSPEHLNWLKETKFDKIVSDKQIAQSYLIRVKDFVEDETIIALIVTSKVYYNDKAQNFKKYFLENNFISQVFDLSPVRHIVFESAKNPGAIIFFKVNLNNIKQNSQSIIKHIALKQNKYFNKFSKKLVIEKFDRKHIIQKQFIENKWMFKIALYGNTLDYTLLKKYKCENFQKYFNSNNITYGKGIEIGTIKKPFPFLEGLSLIVKENFSNYYINESLLKKITKQETFIKAGRTLELFNKKKIVLGKRTSKETVLKYAISSDDTVFTENFYGISFKSDNDLNIFYSILSSNLYLYFQYLTSANWGVYNPEINLNEYLSFPYIEPNEVQKEQLVSLIDNLLKPYKDFYNQFPNMVYTGELSKEILNKINSIIEEIYDIKGYEKDLIDYVLNVSRYQFQDSKQHLVSNFNEADHRNKKQVLKNYAEVYIQEFEKIYDSEFLQVEIYPLEHFIALNFVFLDHKPIEQIIYPDKKNEGEVLKRLAYNLSISQITDAKNSEHNLFIQKDIKGFEKDSFYIIKPNEYKCWHRAMAWYDVAEFKETIETTELTNLNIDFDGF
ncbi:DNA methyltransferase [Empedobacter falsenii]